MAVDVQVAREFFARVRQRPGMFVPAQDWKYITAVAYLEGWFAATGWNLGHEFSAWLGTPSIAWWGTIVDRRYPDRDHPLSEFDAEADALLISDLFDALDQYLAARQT